MMTPNWADGWEKYRDDYCKQYWKEHGVRYWKEVDCNWAVRAMAKRALSKELFDDEFYIYCIADDVIDRLFTRISEDGVEKATSQFRQRREENRKKLEIERQRWDNLREKFGGIVISMDSKIDIYSTGFSVRVLLNSETSFAERKKFLKENRTEFLKWLMYELMRNVKTSRRIGDISFYKPVEMTLLRVPEVEVKFEVKAA